MYLAAGKQIVDASSTLDSVRAETSGSQYLSGIHFLHHTCAHYSVPVKIVLL